MSTPPLPEKPPARRGGLALVAVLVAFFAGRELMRTPHAKPVFCPEETAPSPQTVIMLSASWCGYCRAARDLFVAQAVPYCEYDIEKSATGAARHAAVGARGVPVILIRNETLIGFSRESVLQTLRVQGLLPAG